MKQVLILLVSILIQQSLYAGGGWVKTKGSYYHKFGFSYVTSNGYFSGGNNYDPRLNSSLITASFYTETGIGKGISFEGYLPYFTRHSVEGNILDSEGMLSSINDAAGGVGDPIIGLRFRLLQKSFLAISGAAKLGVPIGKASLGERGNLFTGDDEWNQIVRLNVSAPFGTEKFAGYTTLYGAFNNRSRNFSNELMYGAEIGFNYKPAKLWLIGKLDAVRPNNESPQEFSNGFTSSMSFTNLIIESSYMLTEKHGLTASYTHSIDGNVLLVAPNYSVGFFINVN